MILGGYHIHINIHNLYCHAISPQHHSYFFNVLFEQTSKLYPIGGSSALLRLTASFRLESIALVCSGVSDAVLCYSQGVMVWLASMVPYSLWRMSHEQTGKLPSHPLVLESVNSSMN